jgi:hypothetical protein
MTLVIIWNKLEAQTRPWSKNNIRYNKNTACKFNASSVTTKDAIGAPIEMHIVISTLQAEEGKP